ncbi:MAG: oligosaccharide flippase family protein, partial [Alphaproteobacteria bacterium]|nr:oligosaccharide flippase family protein [Alphaproteobacteria bacterium]
GYFVAGRRLNSSNIFAVAFVAALGASLLGLIFGELVIVPLLYPDESQMVWPAQLAVAGLPGVIFGTIFIEFFRGSLRLGLWNFLRLLPGLSYPLGILLAIGLAGSGGKVSPAQFALVYSLAQLPTALLALLLSWRLALPKPRLSRQSLGEILGFGFASHLASLVALISSRVDQLVIAIFLPSESLGVFVVASTLAQVTGTASSTITLLATPSLNAAKTPLERSRLLGRAMRQSLYLMVAASLMVAMAAKWMLITFFGAEFAQAAPVTMILLLGMIPQSFRDLWVVFFRSINQSRAISRGEVLGLIVSGVTMVLLIPSIGIVGAAAAAVVTRLVIVAYFFGTAANRCDMVWRELLRPSWHDLSHLLGISTHRSKS